MAKVLTPEEQVEMARDKMARQIWRSALAGEMSVTGGLDKYPDDSDYDKLSPDSKKFWERQADNLRASIPELAVIHPDQTPPQRDFDIAESGTRTYQLGYQDSQQKMVKAGFVRVIKGG